MVAGRSPPQGCGFYGFAVRPDFLRRLTSSAPPPSPKSATTSPERRTRSEPVAAKVSGIDRVTETEAEGSEVPTALVAVTDTSYVVPLVRPVIVHEVAVVVVQLLPPGEAVAV